MPKMTRFHYVNQGNCAIGCTTMWFLTSCFEHIVCFFAHDSSYSYHYHAAVPHRGCTKFAQSCSSIARHSANLRLWRWEGCIASHPIALSRQPCTLWIVNEIITQIAQEQNTLQYGQLHYKTYHNVVFDELFWAYCLFFHARFVVFVPLSQGSVTSGCTKFAQPCSNIARHSANSLLWRWEGCIASRTITLPSNTAKWQFCSITIVHFIWLHTSFLSLGPAIRQYYFKKWYEVKWNAL